MEKTKQDLIERAEELNREHDEGQMDYCENCGELWNSEHHMSDECVNLNEDREVEK